MDILSNLVPGLLIAVVTAFLTVKLALRRFYYEQWWSRKAQAYVEILTALFKAKRYAESRAFEIFTPMAISQEQKDQLFEQSKLGFDELLQASVVHMLFLPKDAKNIVENVLNEVEKSWLPDSYEQLNPSLRAIEKSINEIRVIAIRDLRSHKL